MYYAFKIKKTDNALTEMNGILLNDCLAFETKQERQEKLDELYAHTEFNLIFTTRKDVVKEFGRDFRVRKGIVMSDGDAEMFDLYGGE